MSKVALLIGVSEYQSSEFQDLAAAERDVAAMREVLVQSGIGGFAAADVTVLLNPKPQPMREALDRLFAERKSDDLVVLYFSGHGVVDDGGKFHLTTAQTDKGLLNSTAIPAIFVHGLMEGSRSKQQVLILDCCFSGAFAKGMTAKGEAVNLQPQLGGRGRAVLTSSSAVEYSFAQKESLLSIYTQYVVEGLRTGIADEGGDGWISVDELHSFAQAKVREATPVMQPKIYAVEEGYKIILAKAPMGDPKLEYRKEVERLAKQRDGHLSAIVLTALETKQQQLSLTLDVAAAIRLEVLRPYQEFEAKVQRYREALQAAVQPGKRITPEAWEDLGYLQKTLGLTDEKIQPFVKNMKVLPIPSAAKVSKRSPAVKLNSLQSPVPRNLANEVDRQTGQVAQAVKPQSNAGLPDVSPQNRYIQGTKQQRGLWIIVALGGIVTLGGTFVIFVVAVLISSPPKSTTPVTPIGSTIRPSPSTSPSVIKDSPSAYTVFLEKGLEKFDKKDFQGAITDFSEAIKLKPDYAEAYYNRGNAYSELADNNKAITDFSEAIKLKPGYAEAYTGRGIVHNDMGNRQDAITDYEQAIKLKPSYAKSYNNRGNARSALGDNQGAIADYDQAIKLKPDYASAYFNRGNVRSDLGDKKGAISDYDQAIKLKPNDADIYNNRGIARSDLGDKKGAIADYDQAIKLKPANAEAYHSRGIVRNESGGDFQGALADFEQALKLKPEFAEAYHGQASARRNLGDSKGAIADFTQALRLKSDFAEAYDGRAYTYAILGDKQSAITDYQKIVDLYPSGDPRREKAITAIRNLQ